MSRVETIGLVQKVTRAESPRYLAMDKTEKTRTSPPQGDLSSPGVLLVMQFGLSPDLSSTSMLLVTWNIPFEGTRGPRNSLI